MPIGSAPAPGAADRHLRRLAPEFRGLPRNGAQLGAAVPGEGARHGARGGRAPHRVGVRPIHRRSGRGGEKRRSSARTPCAGAMAWAATRSGPRRKTTVNAKTQRRRDAKGRGEGIGLRPAAITNARPARDGRRARSVWSASDSSALWSGRGKAALKRTHSIRWRDGVGCDAIGAPAENFGQRQDAETQGCGKRRRRDSGLVTSRAGW
jgi:hypothetical protein